MAELDFKRNVAATPGGGELPKPYQRQVTADTHDVPNVQGAAQNYAANTNWMSQLGSAVAQKASVAIREQIGTELGKNPQGDLWPSFTEFDEGMNKSYAMQAESVLGLQAQTLISKSNIELASAPRLSAGMIANKQKQVYTGLQKIYSLAPTSIRPNFEHHYGSVMLQQNEHLTTRMLDEQRTDRKNNTELSTKLSTQNAYSFGLDGVDLDKHGDSKPGLQIVKTVENKYKSALAMKDATPLEAKVAVDTARQSYLTGKYTRLALIADKEKKLPEFYKNLADNPPKDISNTDHTPVINGIMQHMTMQQNLHSQQENLLSQEMYNKIATDPTAITGSEFASFESQVSPLKASEMRFKLIQALKSKQEEGTGVADLISNYGSAEAQARATPKIQNAANDQLVISTMRNNPGMSRDDAQMQVSMSAGAPAPAFTKTIKNALWSGDAAQMVAKAKMIDDLQLTGNGHALVDLSDADLALASDIKHNNNAADPSWAARMITENKENQDPTVRKLSQDALGSYIHDNTVKSNKTVDDFVLSKVGLQGGLFHAGFDSPWLKSKYASDILSVFSENFINSRRDPDKAWERTQEHVANNYGKTKINGAPQWTEHPIEKACGFSEGEGLTSINKDVIRQVSQPMKRLKDLYDDNKSDHYWTIEPTNVIKQKGKLSSTLISQIGETGPERLQFVKHTRNGVSTDTEKFPLMLVGNSFNWELNVQTDHGPRTIFMEAPEIGVHKYTPDIKWIREDYLGQYHNFPNEKVSEQMRAQLSSSSNGGE